MEVQKADHQRGHQHWHLGGHGHHTFKVLQQSGQGTSGKLVYMLFLLSNFLAKNFVKSLV